MDRHVLARVMLVGALAAGFNACGGDDDAATGTSPSSTPQTSGSSSAPLTAAPVTSMPFVVTELAGAATYVTGRIQNFVIDEGTLTTDADGAQHSREGTVSYRLAFDDPRVTGQVEGTWNTDRWGVLEDGAMIQWGSATLTNADGTWEGDYAGAYASPVGDIITRWWRGTGAYDGMTFYMWIDGSEPGVPQFDVSGIIFPSDPPPNVTP